MRVGELFISVPRTISFVLALIFTIAIYFFLKKTETGRALRATSQNREVAELMGMNNKYLYCLAFGISIALVGVSSSLLIPLYEVSPSVGSAFSFKCFVIVVLGGQGSIPGALLGGIIIGLVEKFGGILISDAVAQLLVFLVFVAILLFKPNGLLSTEK
jgi:branched-chain amino acid transport system permease protein